MQVTKIEVGRGKKLRIYLNDEAAFQLYPKEVKEYGIREGEELTQDRIDMIYSAVLLKRAKLRCLHILKNLDKTEQQLRTKLTEDEYPRDIIDDAIEYVKSYHYIDDKRYAQSYIESRADRKSKMMIRAELREKGIDEQIIEEALEEADEIDTDAQILRWAEKKHYDPESADFKESQKFFAFLMRRGYSYSDIKKALT